MSIPSQSIPPNTPTAHSPIADLTYRNYDGPLNTRAVRWWIVALAGIRQSMRKKGFWVVAALAVFPYLITLISIYLQSRTAALTGGRNVNVNLMNMPLKGQEYSSQFFQAFGFQEFFLFIITLLVGTSSIAADNQTNALLVYLSKPITKLDYLLGKWLGVAIIIFAVSLAPALLLYMYCLLSFYSDGFFRNEPWLIFRIIVASAVPALVFGALIVGFSAWSKTPRMAGAFFAGAYYVWGMIVGAFWFIRYMGNLKEGILLRHLSISGAIQGLAQNIFGVTQHMMAGNMRRGGLEEVFVRPPELLPVLMLTVGLIAIGLLAARMRIRAVEVVKG